MEDYFRKEPQARRGTRRRATKLASQASAWSKEKRDEVLRRGSAAKKRKAPVGCDTGA